MNYKRENNRFSLALQNPSSTDFFLVNEKGYVEMQEEQIFWLYLQNNNHFACSASVFINDDPMGSFIIKAGDSILLKNPDPSFAIGQFHSLNQESEGWDAAQMNQVNKNSRGVISVSFQAGYIKEPFANVVMDSYDFRSASARGGFKPYGSLNSQCIPTSFSTPTSATHQDMGIGLAGENVQDFETVEFIKYQQPPTLIEVKLISAKSPTTPQIKPTKQVKQTLRPGSLG